jgi:hypothetical protein
MGKQHDGIRRSVYMKPGRAGDIMMSHDQMNAMIDVHLRLQKHIETVNRSWMEMMQKAREEEFVLARELTGCSNPTDAARLCDRWLTSRAARFVADMNRMSTMWVDFLLEAIPASSSDGKSGQGKVTTTEGTM